MNRDELKAEYLRTVNDYMYDILGKCQMLLSHLSIRREVSDANPVLNDEIINLEKLNILSRGVVFCENFGEKKIPFLLTGINPSYDGKGCNPWGILSYTFQEKTTPPQNKKNWHNTYWGKKKKQFCNLCEEMAYFDLFPLIESDQTSFERIFKKDTAFLGRLLELAQIHIEEMSPKLIVHANRSSMYYWGINNKDVIDRGADVNNLKDPWMGYKVERVLEQDVPPSMKKYDRYKLFPFYRITGFIDSNNRINNKKLLQTNLVGSYILEYVMENRPQPDILYSNEDGKNEWTEIWKWVNQNYHK